MVRPARRDPSGVAGRTNKDRHRSTFGPVPVSYVPRLRSVRAGRTNRRLPVCRRADTTRATGAAGLASTTIAATASRCRGVDDVAVDCNDVAVTAPAASTGSGTGPTGTASGRTIADGAIRIQCGQSAVTTSAARAASTETTPATGRRAGGRRASPSGGERRRAAEASGATGIGVTAGAADRRTAGRPTGTAGRLGHLGALDIRASTVTAGAADAGTGPTSTTSGLTVGSAILASLEFTETAVTSVTAVNAGSACATYGDGRVG
jgi:hypothetical protein